MKETKAVTREDILKIINELPDPSIMPYEHNETLKKLLDMIVRIIVK